MTTCTWTGRNQDQPACGFEPATMNARMTHYTFHHLVCPLHGQAAKHLGYHVWPIDDDATEIVVRNSRGIVARHTVPDAVWDRSRRLDAEVRRHLTEVADGWRIANSVPLPMRDAGQEELARGIGTAAIVAGVFLLVCVALAMVLW